MLVFICHAIVICTFIDMPTFMFIFQVMFICIFRIIFIDRSFHTYFYAFIFAFIFISIYQFIFISIFTSIVIYYCFISSAALSFFSFLRRAAKGATGYRGGITSASACGIGHLTICL